jgi:hypothetical protein
MQKAGYRLDCVNSNAMSFHELYKAVRQFRFTELKPPILGTELLPWHDRERPCMTVHDRVITAIRNNYRAHCLICIFKSIMVNNLIILDT